jgi:hypothetical protein
MVLLSLLALPPIIVYIQIDSKPLNLPVNVIRKPKYLANYPFSMTILY